MWIRAWVPRNASFLLLVDAFARNVGDPIREGLERGPDRRGDGDGDGNGDHRQIRSLIERGLRARVCLANEFSVGASADV